MLSDPARETLRPLVMTLRIIVIALAMGVIFFGIFAAVQNAEKPLALGTKMNYLFLAIAGPMFLAGFVVPRLLPMRAATSEAGAAAAVKAIFDPIQTATIVGCALFEAAAFANLFVYLQEGELVHLAISGIALLCILAHFPIPGRIEQRIEEQLQARRDEQQFKT